jgi:hypothetical protein
LIEAFFDIASRGASRVKTICQAKAKQEVRKLKSFWSKGRSHKNVTFSGFTIFGETKINLRAYWTGSLRLI